MLGAVAALAAAATWFYGGFAAAKPPPLPQIEAGKGIDTTQWHIVVHRAWLSARRPDGRPAASGKASLNIEAELTNRTKESSSDIASAFRVGLPAIAPKAVPELWLQRDNTVLTALHPRMSERIFLAWEVPLGSPIPQPLPITLLSKIYKTRDNLVGGSGWFTPKPLAEVRLAVETPDPPVLAQ